MRSPFKAYPTMRDSGVEWAGSVPQHWRIVRAKWLFQKMERPVRPQDELVTCFRDGVVTLRKNRRVSGFTESLKEIGYQGVRRGDLVIHAMDAFAGATGVSDSDGKSTPVYAVCSPTTRDSNPYYYAYCIREMARSHWIVALSRGVRERSTDFRFRAFAGQYVPLPPRKEQLAIVRFLDHTDRLIQRYIRAKERLIELLEEQNQSIIHQAVKGQIDVRTGQPYSAYKDSGVEWLGYVPMHWQSRRLKTLCDMQSGDAITAMSIEETGQYPVFGGNGIRGFSSNYTHDGDFVLIGRQGALCGNVHVVRGRFWASEHAIVATLRRDHINEWFGALLESMNLNQYSISAAQPGLSIDRILNLQASVPPTSEQRAISKHLGAMTAAMQETVKATGREIKLVREYRTRLIADVVTGKLDVREAAVGLPDVDRRGAADDPDDGFNDEAGSAAAAWRHGVDTGSSLVAVSDAERSEMSAGN